MTVDDLKKEYFDGNKSIISSQEFLNGYNAFHGNDICPDKPLENPFTKGSRSWACWELGFEQAGA